MDVVILAGGFGTRLSSVVSDVPKPMAPISGIPFLEYILKYLKKNNFKNIILSVGYKHEVIEDYFSDNYQGMTINYVVEDTPLGTGGAIKKSLDYVTTDDFLVLNGDTFFQMDYPLFLENHKNSQMDITMALKEMENCDRYGTVEVDEKRVLSFLEKREGISGLINAGVYILKRDVFQRFTLPEQFSLESDFFEKKINDLQIGYGSFENYFIDIGIPEDYNRAQTELPELI